MTLPLQLLLKIPLSGLVVTLAQGLCLGLRMKIWFQIKTTLKVRKNRVTKKPLNFGFVVFVRTDPD